MDDPSKLNAELLGQISKLEKKIRKLEQAQIKQKRVEEGLRLSQQQLQLLINAGPDFFFFKDLKLRYRLINSANARFFGLDETEILGKTDKELMPHEAAVSCRQSDEQAILENRMVIAVEQVGDRYYETRKFPVVDAGNIVGVAGIVRDVTDQKRAEEDLRESRDRAKRLFRTSPVPQGIMDPETRVFVECNDAAVRIYGWERRDQLLGRRPIDMSPTTQCSGIESDLAAAQHIETCRRDGVHAFEWCHQRPDGEAWDADVHMTLFRDHGKPYVRFTLRDITDHRRALDALKKAETKYRTIFENASTGIYLTSVQGRFIDANPALARIFGFGSPQELIDSITDIAAEAYVDPDDFGKIRGLCLEQGFLKGYETRFRRKDGSTIWVSMSIRPLKDDAGNVSYFEGTVEDIDERKRAEDALKKSEALLNSIFEASPAGIGLLVDRMILKTNRAFCRVSGYSERELLGRSVRDLYLSDEDYDRVGQLYKRTNDAPGMVEARLRKKDGAVIQVLIGLSPVNPYDQKAGFIASVLDITALKSAETALKQSEEKYRTLIENMYDAVYRCDLDGNLSFASPSAARILGYRTEQEVMGLNIARDFYYFPEKREEFLRILKDQGKVTDYEVVLKRKDDNPVVVSTNTQFHRDKEGTIIGVEGVFSDITKRKHAEEALRQSEELYRTLAAASPDAIVVTDLSGRIVFGSKKSLELFATPEGEGVGRSILDWVAPQDQTRAGAALHQLLTFGEAQYGEYLFVKCDGTPFDAEVHAAPLRSLHGMAEGAIFITRDVTERKNLQSQLLQAQKMEAIGTLAGGVAHDFNNILTAIMGYAGLIASRIRDDDEARSYVNQIQDCTSKAANVTRSLLAFSRKQTMQLQPHSMNMILRDLEKLLRRLVPEDVILTISLDEDVTIMADMTQIDQVLMNLISNAKDAMPKGGELRVEARAAEIGQAFRQTHGFGEPGRYAMISVTDTGSGMDKATRKKIFEPFFTTKEVGKGTGLGLSIVYGIIKQHSGYVTVSSEQGRGTTFEIYLPAVKMNIPETKQAHAPVSGGTETILLAEDEDHVREIVREILRVSGYTIIEAKDGEDALQKYREHRNEIDLFILDVVMPGKNGKEVYDEIRKIDSSVPALFMSGYTGDVVLDKGVQDIAVNYISKPILADDLLRKIREILEKGTGRAR
jgi:two-component system, cell cycle sensor histidine kinase and response regulator CckA